MSLGSIYEAKRPALRSGCRLTTTSTTVDHLFPLSAGAPPFAITKRSLTVRTDLDFGFSGHFATITGYGGQCYLPPPTF